MALSEEDLLSTPVGYATPLQLAATRDYAKALLYGGQQQPVKHWTQGVSNMVNALIGGKELHDASELERSTDKAGAKAIEDVPIPNAPQAVTPTQGAAPGVASPAAPTKALSFDEETPGQPGLTGTQFDGRFPMAGGIPTPSPYMANPKGNAALLRYGAMHDPAAINPSAPLVSPDAPAAIAQALARGNGGQTVGFGGQQALPFDAETSVAANTPKAAASKGLPTAVPSGTPTGDIVDPTTLTHRPQISRGQLDAILTNPRIPQELKQGYMSMYMQQFQPVEAEIPGGKVVVGPTGIQRPVPSIGTNTIKASAPGGGSVDIQEPSILQSDGKGGFKRVIIPTERPGSTGAVPATGTETPPAIPSIKDLKKKSEAAPEEDGSTQPVKLAYAGDDLPPGMLGVKPPGFPTQPVADAAGKAGAEGKVAQNSLIPPDVSRTMDDLQKRGLDYERQKEFNSTDVKASDKSYTDLADAGQRASQGLPMLETLKNIVADRRFYSGIGGTEVVLPYKRLQAQFGNDPTAAAAMEVFQKGVSTQVIEDMKIMLKGLGQVRVAEIDLLSKASASLNNTRPANIAVIELAIRAHKQVDALSKVANEYRQGWTMDKDGEWVRNSGPPTKAGMDELLKRYTEANPVMSPEERQHYEGLFGKYDKTKYAKTKAELEAAAQSSPGGQSTNEPTTKAPPPPPGFR